MIMAVPYSLLITVDACKVHPILAPVYEGSPRLFGKNGNPDWEQLMLVVRLMYEYQLREDSYWFPYIELMPEVTFFCDWDPETIMKTQDLAILEEAREFKHQIDTEWKLLFEHLIRYCPDVFQEETINKHLFCRLYA